MDDVRRIEKATKRREVEIKKTKVQRTEAQWSMTRTSSDLAGLLISIGKIVQREESEQSKDFEEGKWCSSHASVTATCEQRWPKQEGKDQASDTYKRLPCTWKLELSLADSPGVELHLWHHNLSFPRFEDQSHTEGVRTQPGRTRFTSQVTDVITDAMWSLFDLWDTFQWV